MGISIKELKELIRSFDKSDTKVLELETEKFRIYLDKLGPIPNESGGEKRKDKNSQSEERETFSEPEKREASVTQPKVEPEGEIISSPMVGTFYQAPSPDSPPYVRVGDQIKKGDTLCIIEAMKIMNELEAEFDCEILEILVEDGQPVEFDTPLFRVKRV